MLSYQLDASVSLTEFYVKTDRINCECGKMIDCGVGQQCDENKKCVDTYCNTVIQAVHPSEPWYYINGKLQDLQPLLPKCHNLIDT